MILSKNKMSFELIFEFNIQNKLADIYIFKNKKLIRKSEITGIKSICQLLHFINKITIEDIIDLIYYNITIV